MSNNAQKSWSLFSHSLFFPFNMLSTRCSNQLSASGSFVSL